MWVVEDEPAAALPGRGAADTGRDAVARLVIFKPLLGVLVARQREQVTPSRLIPIRLHQPPSLEVVPDAQRAAVARAKELLLRRRDPLPHGPHHRDDS